MLSQAFFSTTYMWQYHLFTWDWLQFYAVKIAPFNFLVTGLSDNAGRMSKNIIGIEIGDEAATGDPRKL